MLILMYRHFVKSFCRWAASCKSALLNGLASKRIIEIIIITIIITIIMKIYKDLRGNQPSNTIIDIQGEGITIGCKSNATPVVLCYGRHFCQSMLNFGLHI